MNPFQQFAKQLPMVKSDWHTFFLMQCLTMTSRSDCTRRRFGALIVNSNQRILSAGYNAPPVGVQSAAQAWANDLPFQMEPQPAPPQACFKVRAGQGSLQNSGYDHCPALHAEQNAILDYGVRELTTHTTTLYIAGRDGQTGELIDSQPCIHCSRMIRQALISRVIYLDGSGVMRCKLPEELPITPSF
mgnify:CR=1 FL=1